MNYKIKRFMLGASTLLAGGVVYAKSGAIPLPGHTQSAQVSQVNQRAFVSDIATLNDQVKRVQAQMHAEAATAEDKAKQLSSLKSTAEALKTQAIAVAEQKAQAKAEQASIAVASTPPHVQSVTRASGGGDDSHHGGEHDRAERYHGDHEGGGHHHDDDRG